VKHLLCAFLLLFTGFAGAFLGKSRSGAAPAWARWRGLFQLLFPAGFLGLIVYVSFSYRWYVSLLLIALQFGVVSLFRKIFLSGEDRSQEDLSFRQGLQENLKRLQELNAAKLRERSKK